MRSRIARMMSAAIRVPCPNHGNAVRLAGPESWRAGPLCVSQAQTAQSHILAISVDHNVQNVAQTCPHPCVVAFRKTADHLRPDRPQHEVRASPHLPSLPLPPSTVQKETPRGLDSSTNAMRNKRTSCSAVTLLRKAWTEWKCPNGVPKMRTSCSSVGTPDPFHTLASGSEACAILSRRSQAGGPSPAAFQT